MRCPNCGKTGRGKTSYLQREMTCPNCKQKVRFVCVEHSKTAEAPSSTRSDAGRDAGGVRGETEGAARVTSGREQRIKKTLWPTEPASRGRRWAEYVIDMGLTFLVGFLLSLFLFLLCGVDVSKHPYLFGVALALLYYVLLEGASGKTIGKMLLRTKVLKEGDQEIEGSSVFLRTLIRFIPGEPLSVFSSTRRMWHDRWTHTVVASTGDLSLARKFLVGILVLLSVLLVGGLTGLEQEYARDGNVQQPNEILGQRGFGRQNLGASLQQEPELREKMVAACREGLEEAGPVGQFWSEDSREAFVAFFVDYLTDLTRIIHEP